MSETRKKKSGIFVWSVMGLLILGLGGFGLTGAFQTSGGSTVASVGNEDITADNFLSALQQDINRTSEQFGQPLTIAQAQLIGIDQSSLRRQVTLAALTNETARLNLSVGDSAVRNRLLANPAFQSGGTFSEATYDLVLNQQRISREEYEDLIRNDQTQTLMSGAISGGVGAQAIAARTLMDFVGENRSLTWAEIDFSVLDGETEAPNGAEIQAFYEADPAAFTTPETRVITYAMLSPALLMQGIDISDAAIQEVFDARQDTLNTPAGRILDRVIFGDMAEAEAAMAQISAGTASFDDIVVERGLSLQDANIGLVSASLLSRAAADLLFGTEETGVYGPVEAILGPAIFRVNAVMAENIVPFEDVEDDIRRALAAEQASALMLTKIGGIDDLIAGGATLEELADETEMQLFTIDFSENATEEVATDPTFTAEALAADVAEDRDLIELADSSIVALRVDEIIPARLRPLEESREQAIAGATNAATLKRVQDYGEELSAQVAAGADLAATISALGLQAIKEQDVSRSSPPADLLQLVGRDVFDHVEGEIGIFPTDTGIVIVQTDSVTPFDAESDEGKDFLAQAESQLSGDIASDVYILFANGIVTNTDITINQGMINQILASIAQ